MNKLATTIEEQINKLKSRGLIITDENIAKIELLNIGYYKLGFYSFPFEKNYPNKRNRDHIFKEETKFEDILSFYEFDYSLRLLLANALNRIETHLRTTISYNCSIEYINNPIWFADPLIIKANFTDGFEKKVYSTIKKNRAITIHHKKYKNQIYAPAWKTLEFMTMGNMSALYENIIDENLKNKISNNYGCTVGVFVNYFHTLRFLRNECAHGGCIYDMSLYDGITKGPAGEMKDCSRHNIKGIIIVLRYMLGKISLVYLDKFNNDLSKLLNGTTNAKVKRIISDDKIGLDFFEKNNLF